ncbi:MAG TPA: DegT/DnrJ/EryC1/StrS family aminotransferase [Candidatus Acidoferrales bacterium]
MFRATHVIAPTIPNIMANGIPWLRTNPTFSLPKPTAYPAGTFPNTERACERVLSLPIFPSMTAEQVNYVASAVLEVVGKK